MTISRRTVSGGFWIGVPILLLLSVGLIDGRTVVEKIAQRLFSPLGLVWIGLAFQFRAALVRRHTSAMALSFALWLVLTLSGNGLLIGTLIDRQEQPYLAIDPFREPPYDALIVLGGGATQGANGRSQVNSAGDRIVLAAQLYRAGQARRIICTGQRVLAIDPDQPDPAEQGQAILTALGVPEGAIVHSGGTNTSEEFVRIAEVLQPGERVGLVTSAWHMPRAQRLALKQGLQVHPVPADFQGAPPQADRPFTLGAVVMGCIPDAEALLTAARWEKEQLARLVGR